MHEKNNLPGDIEQALERFVDEQAVAVQLTAVMETTVRENLYDRVHLPNLSRLHIRPAKRGSGQDDVSAAHDRELSGTPVI